MPDCGNGSRQDAAPRKLKKLPRKLRKSLKSVPLAHDEHRSRALYNGDSNSRAIIRSEIQGLQKEHAARQRPVDHHRKTATGFGPACRACAGFAAARERRPPRRSHRDGAGRNLRRLRAARLARAIGERAGIVRSGAAARIRPGPARSVAGRAHNTREAAAARSTLRLIPVTPATSCRPKRRHA